jgi:hypothetical protein
VVAGCWRKLDSNQPAAQSDLRLAVSQVDLPAAVARVDLPAAVARVDLPAAVARVDLPAGVAQVGRPTLSPPVEVVVEHQALLPAVGAVERRWRPPLEAVAALENFVNQRRVARPALSSYLTPIISSSKISTTLVSFSQRFSEMFQSDLK